MNKFWRKFDNLSYYKKLKGIFYTLFIVIAIILLALGIILLRNMTEGIYERNQEKLSLITYNIQNELSEAQKLTLDIGQNKIIQDNLKSFNNNDSQSDASNYQKAIEKEMSWLQVNKINIKNTLILNNRGEVASGSLLYDGDHSIMEKVSGLASGDTIGKWYFDKDLRSSIYVRHLYGTQEAPIKKIGSMVIYFNTSFIQDLLDSSDIFSKEDFVMIHYDNQLVSTNIEMMKSLKKGYPTIGVNDLQSTRYSFQEIAGDKYFKLTKTISISNNQIPITYFLLNNEMIGKVIGIITMYYLLVVVVMTISIFIVNSFIRRLVNPINLLAENMSKFRGKNDFSEITTNLDSTREDEIGLLNQSYKQLVAEIEELIKIEFETKILSQEMEYKFLQSQLNPHFLYNALDSINWMAIKKGNTDISVMVTSLATLLRSKLDIKKEYNTIDEELEIIEAYIAIQKVRFKSRLHFDVDIEENLRNSRIPKLVIQPLIENSIKYGLEKEEGIFHITLAIYQVNDSIHILVQDDGPGFEASINGGSTGIGLENIKTRLNLIYGEKSKVTITSEPFEKTVVELEIAKEAKKWGLDSEDN